VVKKVTLTPSLEDYLETILLLERKNRVARVKEIAAHLQVQMPSVTGALKTLRNKELINYEKNSYISLTEKGLSVASAIENRHDIILTFLEKVLLLPPEAAADQACKIEHVITTETAQRLKNCTRYLTDHYENGPPVNSSDWESIISSNLP
jgi:DtxR family transcriptional regulator, Mn-dependent transcriptional regulator